MLNAFWTAWLRTQRGQRKDHRLYKRPIFPVGCMLVLCETMSARQVGRALGYHRRTVVRRLRETGAVELSRKLARLDKKAMVAYSASAEHTAST